MAMMMMMMMMTTTETDPPTKVLQHPHQIPRCRRAFDRRKSPSRSPLECPGRMPRRKRCCRRAAGRMAQTSRDCLRRRPRRRCALPPPAHRSQDQLPPPGDGSRARAAPATAPASAPLSSPHAAWFPTESLVLLPTPLPTPPSRRWQQRLLRLPSRLLLPPRAVPRRSLRQPPARRWQWLLRRPEGSKLGVHA